MTAWFETIDYQIAGMTHADSFDSDSGTLRILAATERDVNWLERVYPTLIRRIHRTAAGRVIKQIEFWMDEGMTHPGQ